MARTVEAARGREGPIHPEKREADARLPPERREAGVSPPPRRREAGVSPPPERRGAGACLPGAELAGCEVGELYRTFAKPLQRVIGADLDAPPSVIEDACQFAWARLVHNRGRVRRETAFGWLVKTALHEAFKLIRRRDRELSLEAEVEAGYDTPDAWPAPLDVCEQRERLRTVTSLATRQQRVLWLYGLGLTYAEIAAHDGCTARTVERQLQRARATLRAADAR